MINCRQTTRLVSLGLDRKLPVWMRALVRLHLLWCRSCRNVQQQLLALRRITNLYGSDDPIPPEQAHPDLILSPESKARISQKLRSL